MDVFFKTVLSNPVLMGMLIKAAVDLAKRGLQAIDENGWAVKNKQWIQPVVIVLSFLATTLTLAAQGHLADTNVQAVVDFLGVYLSSQGMQLVGDKVLKKDSTGGNK